MSSALAAWDQPAQAAAPVGNWPRIADPATPPAPPSRREPAEPPGPPSRREPAEPPGPPSRREPAEPPGPPGRYEPDRRPGRPQPAPAQPARPARPRHATAAEPRGDDYPVWDREVAARGEPYLPATAPRAAPRHHAAPFPPAQNPAELYPAPPVPGRPGGPPPARSRPPAQRRSRPGGVLIGAACLAVLAAIALILFVALPG